MVYPVSNLPEEEKRKPKTVGVDANLARHLNFIFGPGTKEGERVKQWVHKHPTTGKPVVKRIAVQGSLGAAELRTFFVLCKLRQESASPDVEFSLQQTAKYALLEWHGAGGTTKNAEKYRTPKRGGKSTADSLHNALMHLRGGLLILSNIYFDQEKGEFITAEGITILDKLRVVQHTPIDPATGELDHAATTLRSLFRFNPMIENSITSGFLKPIVLDAFLSIDKRATAAAYAYLWLDRKLYKRNRWIEPSKTLLPAIGLTGNYSRPAERKRVLDTIAKHIDGLAISTGFIRVTVVKRGGDWCLSASKLSRAQLTEPRRSQTPALEVEAERTSRSPRAHYEQHRTEHPEPVEGCADCRTVAALLKIGSLKRAATPEDHATIEPKPEAQPAPIATPDATPAPEATMLPEEQQPPVAQPDPEPTTTPTPRVGGVGVLSFESLSPSPAVAPSVPEQSGDTTTPARPTGLAPSEIADA